jgi:hypothetical protein
MYLRSNRFTTTARRMLCFLLSAGIWSWLTALQLADISFITQHPPRPHGQHKFIDQLFSVLFGLLKVGGLPRGLE